MNNQRIESLKFMRVVAMLLVVLIHATAVAITTLEPDHILYSLYLLLNRFTRFEGSVFVFLSGVVLFYNYEHRPYTKRTWLDFYKKRFMYILVPYLLWSLFYEGFSHVVGSRPYTGLTTIVKNILLGQSNYQLYFILILVQLYFLLPVFIYLIKRFHFIKRYLFLIGFVVELVFQVLNRTYGWISIPFFTVYLASFLFGGWIGVYYNQFKHLLSRQKLIIWTSVTVILGLLYTSLYYLQDILKIPILAYPFYKLIAMTFYLLSCYVLFKASLWLEQNVSATTDRIIENLRIYSFGFYLVHPFILTIWERLLVAETAAEFHIFIFARYIFVVISCYVFIKTIHLLLPRAWIFFGKLPAPVKK